MSKLVRIDRSVAQGNWAILGWTKSGKTTMLRAIIMAAAETYTPEEVRFYCLDFGGGGLARLVWVPHVGSVALRPNESRVRRTIAHLVTLLRKRETAPAPEGGFSTVYLVIDGWPVLHEEYDALEHQIVALAFQGPAYGIYLMLTARPEGQIRPSFRDQLTTSIELPPGDPSDAESHAISEQADAARADLIARYGRRRAPEIPLLPFDITREQLLKMAQEHGMEQGPTKAVIGLGESELQPVALDFAIYPHFMAFAEPESGKTTLLRNIIRGIADNSTAQQARMILIDYRRTLLGSVHGDQLAGYSTTSHTAQVMVQEIVDYFAQRTPGSGFEIYVVIDDYDLVATAQNPLTPLIALLPQGGDIGLHVIVTRRTRDMSRALTDPFLSTLAAMSTPTLVMSGSRDDGRVIADIRPCPLPPGRGTFLTRTNAGEVIQIANLEDK